jgi:uncharacterized protein (TIGR02466 family)
MNIMNKDFLFPTPIYVKTFNLNNRELEKSIVSWSEEKNGINKSNMNGWHSDYNMQNKDEYKDLVNELNLMQNEILKEENLVENSILTTMWANINYVGSSNKSHIHPNSLWSGVYYIKTQKNCGSLVLEDPRIAGLMIKPQYKSSTIQRHQASEIKIEPIEGKCIMFPAWLSHSVDINNSNDKRISVSFNFG